MIYVGTHSEGGCGIYLDIHAVERDERGPRVSAIIGDGYFEGEVQIALGRDFHVIFLDAFWGDKNALAAFLDRHGEEKLHHDLFVSLQSEICDARVLRGSVGCRPHPYTPFFSTHGLVSEHGA